MSSETLNGVPVGGATTVKPVNPYLAGFRPYIPAEVVLPELTILPLIVGTLLGWSLARHRSTRLEDRLDRKPSIPVCGHIYHIVSRVLEDRVEKRHDSRKQHRPDRGFGG